MVAIIETLLKILGFYAIFMAVCYGLDRTIHWKEWKRLMKISWHRYYYSLPCLHGKDDFVAVIPKVQSKEELFVVMNERLRFPEYFMNERLQSSGFFILSMLLADLNWINQEKNYVYHECLSDFFPPQDLAEYLDTIY